jgi:RNA polymerase sigma factor (sigma-70 family)
VPRDSREQLPPGDPPAPLEGLLTGELVQRAQQGDAAALALIAERYLPRLERWASGRLPSYARALFDTADLVQETMLRTLAGIERIDARPGAFQSYVRQAVLNRIRDQIRWASRRGGPQELPEELVDGSQSPLEDAIGGDLLARYEQAMAAIREEDRLLLHLRIELDFEYGEIAAMTGHPSPDAARMAFQRALGRLAEVMGHEY